MIMNQLASASEDELHEEILASDILKLCTYNNAFLRSARSCLHVGRLSIADRMVLRIYLAGRPSSWCSLHGPDHPPTKQSAPCRNASRVHSPPLCFVIFVVCTPMEQAHAMKFTWMVERWWLLEYGQMQMTATDWGSMRHRSQHPQAPHTPGCILHESD